LALFPVSLSRPMSYNAVTNVVDIIFYNNIII
jgi:hypothetical protein